MAGMLCKVHKIGEHQVLCWVDLHGDGGMCIKTKFPKRIIPESLKVGDQFAWIIPPTEREVKPEDIHLTWTEEELAHTTKETLDSYAAAMVREKTRTYLVLFQLGRDEDTYMATLPLVLYAEEDMTEEEIADKFLTDFLAVYADGGSRERVVCCMKPTCRQYKKSVQGKFCNECGEALAKTKFVDPDILDARLREIFNQTSVEFDAELETQLQQQGWEIWQRPSPCFIASIGNIDELLREKVTNLENCL